MEAKKNEKETSSPESDGEYNGMDIMDKHEKNYMSPIVSLNIPNVPGNAYMSFSVLVNLPLLRISFDKLYFPLLSRYLE